MLNAKALSGGLLILLTVVCGGICDRAVANEIFQNTLRAEGGTAADVQAIQNLIQEKQFDKAMKAIDALEKKQPRNPTIFNLRGGVYLSKNDVANARKTFEQALALDAKSTVASFNLAQLDLFENNAPAARQRFRSILENEACGRRSCRRNTYAISCRI